MRSSFVIRHVISGYLWNEQGKEWVDLKNDYGRTLMSITFYATEESALSSAKICSDDPFEVVKCYQTSLHKIF